MGFKVGDKVIAITSNSIHTSTDTMKIWFDKKTILKVSGVYGTYLYAGAGTDFIWGTEEVEYADKYKRPKMIPSWKLK